MQYTLEPLVYIGPSEGKPKSEWKLKSAKELLNLKICDMACGSGAFLVQADRYMAERLLEAWDAAKQANPNTPGITPEGEPSTGRANETLIPDDPVERKTYAMRIIAQRCLYGVDKNPLAAEMAKLSLWLLTLAKDKPFEFLDHSIRCGDSLVGLNDIAQLRHFNLKPDPDDAVLFKGPLDEAVDEAINLRLRLEDLPSNTVEDVERQETLLKEANEKIARLRCAADLLVAAELWGDNPKDKLERIRYAAMRSEQYVEKGPIDEFEKLAVKERRGQTMFHWPLQFPEVIVKQGGFDAFVGNPPFMGGQKISGTFGSEYRTFVVANVGDDSKGSADLCVYFLLRACHAISANGHIGILATKTISEGDTRDVGLSRICSNDFCIIRANKSQKWPGTAVLEVAHLWLRRGRWNGSCVLDGKHTHRITPFLTRTEQLVGTPHKLASNRDRSFQGAIPLGMGFVLDPLQAADIIATDNNYTNVIWPYLNGSDLNSGPRQSPSRYVINFFDWPLDKPSSRPGYSGPVATDFPIVLEIVKQTVKPERDRNKRKVRRERWWQFAERAPALYRAIANDTEVLVCSEVTKHLAFCFVPTHCVFTANLDVFPGAQFFEFSLLQSSLHDCWARTYSSVLRVDLKYSPGNAFETFPFPNEQIRLQTIGRTYHDLRQRIMAKRNEGLTNTYNRFHDPDELSTDIQELRELHVEMDQAALTAYGWSDCELDHGFHETKQGIRFTMSEPGRREVVERLLKLNHERYAEEVRQALHSKKGAGNRPARAKIPASTSTNEEATLFEMDAEEP